MTIAMTNPSVGTEDLELRIERVMAKVVRTFNANGSGVRYLLSSKGGLEFSIPKNDSLPSLQAGQSLACVVKTISYSGEPKAVDWVYGARLYGKRGQVYYDMDASNPQMLRQIRYVDWCMAESLLREG